MAMGISVDSLDRRQARQVQRARADAYDLTMAGIEACKQAGLPFQLHTTVVDWNRDEVCAITDFAVRRSARWPTTSFFLIPVGRGVFIQETGARGAGERSSCSKDIMLEGCRRCSIDVKPTLRARSSRAWRSSWASGRGSSAAAWRASTYCVDRFSEGIVRPCAYMTEEAGDVRDDSRSTRSGSTSPVFEQLAHRGVQLARAAPATTRRGAAVAVRAPRTTTTATSCAQDEYCAHGLQLF